MPQWFSPISVHSYCGQHPTYPATKFIDGNIYSYWHHPDNHYHWIVVDLEESKYIEKVRVFVASTKESHLIEVNVYISDDPENWGDPVATNLNFTAINQWNERDITPKTGRYVKLEHIHTQETYPRNSLQAREFEVYVGVIPPTVTTQVVDNIEKTTATGHGTITNIGGENCDKRGVCWNTIGNPTVADNKSEEINSFGVGPFTRAITGLEPGQKYYIKAYAHNSKGYGYGDQKEFTTIPLSIPANPKAYNGYLCFMEQYIKNKAAGKPPLKLPDGTTW